MLVLAGLIAYEDVPDSHHQTENMGVQAIGDDHAAKREDIEGAGDTGLGAGVEIEPLIGKARLFVLKDLSLIHI